MNKKNMVVAVGVVFLLGVIMLYVALINKEYNYPPAENVRKDASEHITAPTLSNNNENIGTQNEDNATPVASNDSTTQEFFFLVPNGYVPKVTFVDRTNYFSSNQARPASVTIDFSTRSTTEIDGGSETSGYERVYHDLLNAYVVYDRNAAMMRFLDLKGQQLYSTQDFNIDFGSETSPYAYGSLTVSPIQPYAVLINSRTQDLLVINMLLRTASGYTSTADTQWAPQGYRVIKWLRDGLLLAPETNNICNALQSPLRKFSIETGQVTSVNPLSLYEINALYASEGIHEAYLTENKLGYSANPTCNEPAGSGVVVLDVKGNKTTVLDRRHEPIVVSHLQWLDENSLTFMVTEYEATSSRTLLESNVKGRTYAYYSTSDGKLLTWNNSTALKKHLSERGYVVHEFSIVTHDASKTVIFTNGVTSNIPTWWGMEDMRAGRGGILPE